MYTPKQNRDNLSVGMKGNLRRVSTAYLDDVNFLKLRYALLRI
jgi:hypothetical protein